MPGYAVVDLETTGLAPGRQNRIVELAVVHVSSDGEITGSWETLVNPRRDLGPQRIHRVTAAQTAHAPTFDLVAEELAALLAGRVVVAHNLRFDGGFLAAEYGRQGYRVPLGPHVGMCTMQLAGRYLPKAGRSLAACCAAFGITISDAHRASADADATARLLAGYLRMDPGGPRWSQEQEVAAEHPWPTFTLPRGEWIAREHATMLGVRLAYLGERASSALAEGTFTDADRAELCEVAASFGLGTDHVDDALRAAANGLALRRFSLAAGDKVVFTGEMRRERPDWERRAVDAGLRVHPAVTKTVKLLVAADPDTLSGKGRKARDYGIPVVTEDAFDGMLADPW